MKSIIEKGSINRKQSDPLESEEIKFLLNSLATLIDNPKGLLHRVWIWLLLLYCLKGGDAKQLKASWLSELSNGRMRLELPKEKIILEFKPVAVIKKYLTKCPNNVEDDYFFITINTPKNVYHGNWYLQAKLGKGSHDNMMHAICSDAKLDFKGHTITNHSMRLTGKSAYQHQSMKRKFDNVLNLIPLEEAELGSHLALADEMSTHEQESGSILNNSILIYNNQLGFIKASELYSAKCNKRSEVFGDSKFDNNELNVPKIYVENCSNIIPVPNYGNLKKIPNQFKDSDLNIDILKKSDGFKVSYQKCSNLKKILNLFKVSGLMNDDLEKILDHSEVLGLDHNNLEKISD
ncbi:hypothetical protein C2G38_2192223 [Gigaspora rosea]|uniref:Uncharacterized protein n=1 Tax=Gigaspora rosea TaxID=44941 RepID=A0A397V6D2_9GLOM|nr:hypothetical protein C2G38_2192223 [Gigaspora rosea]